MKLRLALILLPLLLWAGPAFGQGCAMCYSSAKAGTKDGLRAINKAVVVLLVPPLGVMTVGLGLAFRYGKKRDDDERTEDQEDGKS